MAINESAEEIRAARGRGEPIADPAKLEKILRPVFKLLDEKFLETDARPVDILMTASNVARWIISHSENPDWDIATAAHYHQLFLRTLAQSLARDLVKRKGG